MRVKILVEINTDMVPGWGYDPRDFVDLIARHLETVSHYNPTVTLVKEGEDKKD